MPEALDFAADLFATSAAPLFYMKGDVRGSVGVPGALS